MSIHMKQIDLNSWNRREHYEFFSRMASPFFGIVTEVDCTRAYQRAKEEGISFFASYFHKSMIAANTVPELKYRIIDGKVFELETIHAGSTATREDGTFAFIFVPFSENFEEFNRSLQSEFEAVGNSSGLRLNNDDVRKDLIRHSVLPWTHFSALLHPTNFDQTESVPKITFGKYSVKEGKKMLPVSIEAHHGLADGYHIARYLEEFQRLLDL